MKLDCPTEPGPHTLWPIGATVYYMTDYWGKVWPGHTTLNEMLIHTKELQKQALLKQQGQ